MKPRIELLDFIKGVAILLVVLGHAIQSQIGVNNPEVWNNSVFVIIYSFHMPLFFFLSGISFNFYKDKPFFKTIIARAKNLLLPFLAWGILISFILQKDKKNILGLIENPGNHLWFLIVLFNMIFITLIIYKSLTLFPFFSNKLFISIILIISLIFFLKNNLADFLGINLLLPRYIYFIGGVIIFEFKDFLNKHSEKLILITLLGLCFNEVLIRNLGSNYLDINILILIRTFLLIYLVIYIIKIVFKTFTLITKYFSYLGKHSLEIYIVHWVLIFYFSVKVSSQLSVVDIIFSTVFLTCISLFIYKVIQSSNKYLNTIFLGGR